MMTHADLLAELTRLKREGHTTNAELGRLLGLPSSRIAEIFAGKRLIRVDEMNALVRYFGLGNADATTDVATIERLLAAILDGPFNAVLTDQTRGALAEALSQGLWVLGPPTHTPPNEEVLAVSGRIAALRFREALAASAETGKADQ